MVLHLSLVFFEVRESLLQVDVLLPLRSHGLVEEFSVVLDDRYDLLQVVVILSLKGPLHGCNVGTVNLDSLLVVLQFLLRAVQVIYELLDVGADVDLVLAARARLEIIRYETLVARSDGSICARHLFKLYFNLF